MCTFTLESTHFIFSKCPIYTHDSASAKFSTNSHKTDYSVECLPTIPGGPSSIPGHDMSVSGVLVEDGDDLVQTLLDQVLVRGGGI